MKSKGFTLIELLAVIVILAIIALIAVPVVLNIIDDSKKQGTIRSIENYLKAVEIEIAAANLNDPSTGFIPGECEIKELGAKLYCTGFDPIDIKVDGEKPTSGKIVLKNGSIVSFSELIISREEYEKEEGGEITKVGDTEETPEGDGGTGSGNGDSEILYTGTIYRISSDKLSIGDNISGISYETDPMKLDSNVYLSHTVDKDIITESYACIAYVEDGTPKETCVRGGLVDDDIHNQNKAMIAGLKSYYSTLIYTDSADGKGECKTLSCRSQYLDIYIKNTGQVNVWHNDFACYVYADSSSDCTEE